MNESMREKLGLKKIIIIKKKRSALKKTLALALPTYRRYRHSINIKGVHIFEVNQKKQKTPDSRNVVKGKNGFFVLFYLMK